MFLLFLFLNKTIMKLQLLSVFALAILVVSCKKEQNVTVQEDSTIDTVQNKAVGDSAATVQEVASTAPVTPSSTGLNPEHGLPGHRCDIPVGAPLTSAPTTNNQVMPQSMQPSMLPQTAPAPVQNSTPAAGLNPEHGMPGHRCDIPVGAPLS